MSDTPEVHGIELHLPAPGRKFIISTDWLKTLAVLLIAAGAQVWYFSRYITKLEVSIAAAQASADTAQKSADTVAIKTDGLASSMNAGFLKITGDLGEIKGQLKQMDSTLPH